MLMVALQLYIQREILKLFSTTFENSVISYIADTNCKKYIVIQFLTSNAPKVYSIL